MKLTVIGCKTFLPQQDWMNSCYLLQSNDQTIIFDMGRGSLKALVESGIDPLGIQTVIISHTHFDHVTDLFPFLHFRMCNKGLPLTVFLPEGCSERIREVFRLMHGGFDETDGILLCDYSVDAGILLGDGIQVHPFQVDHHPKIPCFGFAVSSQEKKFIYSGDTALCDELVDNCRDADLILVECNNHSTGSFPGHMNSRDIHELVSRSVPKQAVLTHVSPRNGEVNDEIIKGVPVRIAYNGLVVEF